MLASYVRSATSRRAVFAARGYRVLFGRAFALWRANCSLLMYSFAAVNFRWHILEGLTAGFVGGGPFYRTGSCQKSGRGGEFHAPSLLVFYVI